jgi:hypothetical protein
VALGPVINPPCELALAPLRCQRRGFRYAGHVETCNDRSSFVGVMQTSTDMWRLLERDRERQTPGRSTTAVRERARTERILRCAHCSHVVAPIAARVEMNGAHRHTFCNPAGHVFDLGCFTEAPGCTAIGEASEFFSWFPGYAWRVGVCRGCTAHLGWAYGGRPDFWGLIVDRLLECERDD